MGQSPGGLHTGRTAFTPPSARSSRRHEGCQAHLSCEVCRFYWGSVVKTRVTAAWLSSPPASLEAELLPEGPATDHAAGVASGCQGNEGSFIKQGFPGLGSDLRRPRAKAHLSLGKARFFPHSRALCVLTLHVVFLSPHSCLVVMLCLLVWGLRAPCRGPVHHTTHN